MSTTQPTILRVDNLKKHYTLKSLFSPPKIVKALDGVSFELKRQQTLAIVGESGCGKSTLAKTLMRIEKATSGEVFFEKDEFRSMEETKFRKKIQMIFQDPYGSLNPRKKAWQIISEPLQINTDLSMKECREQAGVFMKKVGLRPESENKYPHMFSGGQRQRMGIARALALQPEILLCDEPVSALDVSVQAQVINLLMELQSEFQLSYLFISHDLSVVQYLADSVLVIYLGKLVEYGERGKIFTNPKHPYTQALLASTPKISGQKAQVQALEGELPSPLNPPSGCVFHKRCPIAKDHCKTDIPNPRQVDGRTVACHEA